MKKTYTVALTGSMRVMASTSVDTDGEPLSEGDILAAAKAQFLDWIPDDGYSVKITDAEIIGETEETEE